MKTRPAYRDGTVPPPNRRRVERGPHKSGPQAEAVEHYALSRRKRGFEPRWDRHAYYLPFIERGSPAPLPDTTRSLGYPLRGHRDRLYRIDPMGPG